MNDKVKPFLRWAGSKRKQIPLLRVFWKSTYKRYVEPFAGSSCLFFDLQPTTALLADKNAGLMETYKLVRECAEEVFERLQSLSRTKHVYYRERSRDISKLSPLDRAVRFIFLNQNCFNGIYRTNLNGEFNVPFSPVRAGRFVTKEEFLACAQLLDRAELRNWDFGTTLRYVDKGDFVYLDPPYAVSGRRVFREYGAKHFSSVDLERLSVHLSRIHERGAHFLVSYADCREARPIAANWNSKRIRVRRNIAGFAGARRFSFELLITNIDH